MLYPVSNVMFVIVFFLIPYLRFIEKERTTFSSLSIFSKRDLIQTPRARSSSILSNSFLVYYIDLILRSNQYYNAEGNFVYQYLL